MKIQTSHSWNRKEAPRTSEISHFVENGLTANLDHNLSDKEFMVKIWDRQAKAMGIIMEALAKNGKVEASKLLELDFSNNYADRATFVE